MGGTVISCCKEPTPTTQQSPGRRLPVERQKPNRGQRKPVPDSGETNTQTNDENPSVDPQGSGQQFIDDKIKQILDKRVRIKRKIEFDDFQIDGKLGEGGFAVVFLGQLKSNIEIGKVQKYAIKKVSKQLLIKKKVYANAKDEKNILAMYDCKFIVALIMAFQDPWFIYFVMQCAVGGDTYSLIKKSSPKLPDYKALGEKAVRFIAACVILGLEFLHKNNYMYRDLKPQNVLIFQNGYVKLTDFGLAKKSVQGDISKTISGTQFYYAPEMVLKKGYNKQIDLWTLGVYLYEMSNYQPPFSTQQISRARFQTVCIDSQNNRVWKNRDLSPELKDLIHNLLRFNQKNRIGSKGGWQEIKNHAFFKDFDWKALEEQKMQSPLKDLVAKFPTALKAYKPQPPRKGLVEPSKLEGWTYVRNQKMKEH